MERMTEVLGGSEIHLGSWKNFSKVVSLVLGGAFLVSGTCIGAGMLGLPVSTSAAGFYATTSSFILTWILMTFTALAFLEVSLLVEGETNLITLAQLTLGKLGKKIAWVTYLLFLYSVMAAYTAGGTTILAQAFGVSISNFANLAFMSAVFILPFAFILYLGTKGVDYTNRLLMAGLVIAFTMMCFMVSIGKTDFLIEAQDNSKYILFSLPLLVTSFGYHLLIPTLKTYFNNDVKKLRLAIIIGGLIPFAIYTIWNYIILSLVPTWSNVGLVSMLHGEGNPADLLVNYLGQNHAKLATRVACFSFFALTSSFIGVALSIYDFFADGLKVKKNHSGKITLVCLTFIPPALYTLIYPKGFLLALNYAGVFASILLIIYPVIMAWNSRYNKNITNKYGYKVSGGRLALLFALLCGVAVILSEILAKLGFLAIPHL